MNWCRKSPSHRARAEQGLEDTVGLDGWVSGTRHSRQREQPGQRLWGFLSCPGYGGSLKDRLYWGACWVGRLVRGSQL